MSQASKEAVRRGAALLDREMPGWEAKVNVDRLDLMTTDRCVLGWVYGNGRSHKRRWRRKGYVVGIIRLFGGRRCDLAGLRRDLAGLHGFDIPDSAVWCGWEDRAQCYLELEREWEALLADRNVSAQS